MPSPTLPVMEQFYTLQGEGAHSGKPAYFIRLGGCDVGCVWCDVKESWDAAKHPSISVEEILNRMGDPAADIVVITGGEPLMYDLTELTAALQQKGFKTHIETSGVYPLTGSWDWICVSPKKFKEVRKDVLRLADELKVVIYHKSDFDWAETFTKEVKQACCLLLQPEWSKCDSISLSIIEYVQAHPKWSVSLQTHKYLNIP